MVKVSISTALTVLIRRVIRVMKTKHMGEHEARRAGSFSHVLPNSFRLPPRGGAEVPMGGKYMCILPGIIVEVEGR